jgi:putative ABC transport system permease protein
MNWLDSFTQDIRYGARQLLKSPGFALVAVLSLALGIGANTAIFQLVDAVRLKTLPVKNPEELATVDFAKGSNRSGWFSTRTARLTYGQFDQIRNQQQAFSGVLAWAASRFNLSPGGEARYAEGMYVSGPYFQVLGTTPVIGRVFSEEDDRLGCGNPGAVLSYAFWQREFAADPAVLGKSVTLDGHPFPVIGVTPASFFGLEVGHRFDVAIPLCADPMFFDDKKGRIPKANAWWLSMMGRLKPGWTVERANAHLIALSPGIMQATLPAVYRPADAKTYLANKLNATAAGTGISGLRRQYDTPLSLMLAITALVLLIACANLANLLLARASIREREVAVRLAIGASRWRLVRQLLAESLLLAAIGAIVGALLAQVLSRGLIAFLDTPGSPVFVGLSLDWRVLGFTAGLAAITCILFGLLPSLTATRMSPAMVLRSGSRGTTAGRERFGMRRALVSFQVALSLVLSVGAILFVRSLQNLMAVDPGFRPEGVLAVSLDFKRPGYPKERRAAAYLDFARRLSAQPGVSSVAQVQMTPISGSGWNEGVRLEGQGESTKNSFFNGIGPGYFRTMGTAFIGGRDFSEHDNTSSQKVAVVNEVFAKTFFAGANPVGRIFRVPGNPGKPDRVYEIVGFIKNTKYYDLREDFLPIAFVPIAQDDDPSPDATYVLRYSAPLGGVMNAVKSAIAEVSPQIQLEFTPLSRQVDESLMRERLMATLSGAFGILAGLLATLGLYGVIAYMVARRRNEIGVRIALGAGRGQVIRLVLREAVVLLAVGLGVGALLSVWAARAATTLLFGLKPYDPVTLLAGMALLTAVALAASFIPARRAAGLEPMAALREE